MRVFSALLFLAAVAVAQDSPLSAVYRLERMPDELIAYADNLVANNQEPTDKLLRQKVFQMFEASLTGGLLAEAKQEVDSGLSKGWALANTGAFDWAFPLFPHRISAAKIVSDDGQEAVVEYQSRSLNTLVLAEDSISQELKGIYQDWRVTSPPLKQLLSEAKISGDFVYHVRSEYLVKFRLKKTVLGWRVVDWEESLIGSQVLAEG